MKSRVKQIQDRTVKDQPELGYNFEAFNSMADQSIQMAGSLTEDSGFLMVRQMILKPVIDTYRQMVEMFAAIVADEKYAEFKSRLAEPYKKKMKALREKYNKQLKELEKEFFQWNSKAGPFEAVPERFRIKSENLYAISREEHIKLNKEYMSQCQAFIDECLNAETEIKQMACSMLKDFIKQGAQGIKVENGEIVIDQIVKIDLISGLKSGLDTVHIISEHILVYNCETIPMPEWKITINRSSFPCRIKDDDCRKEVVFRYPVSNDYPVVSKFGLRQIQGNTEFHRGIDLDTPMDTPFKSILSEGTVYEAVNNNKDNGGAGNYLMIKHQVENTVFYVQYNHLNSVMVKVGDKINQDIILGKTGNSGRSTSPHLDIKIFSKDSVSSLLDCLIQRQFNENRYEHNFYEGARFYYNPEVILKKE